MKSLTIWTGPVASEKTTKALHYARRLLRRGTNLPFVVRPVRSVRAHEHGHPGFLVSKSGLKFPSMEIEHAADLFEATYGCGAAWIDEPMLWSDEELVLEQVAKIRYKMPVLVSGCAATSELTPFGSSLPRLLAVADKVHFCRADCDECGTLGTATRSVCLVSKKDSVLVGGEESYKPVCPDCWSRIKTVADR